MPTHFIAGLATAGVGLITEKLKLLQVLMGSGKGRR